MMKGIRKQFVFPKGFLGILAGKVMAWENQQLNKWSIDYLELTDSEHILEVGFGSGLTIKRMVKGYPSIYVQGIDISKTMKEEAEKRLKHEIRNNRVQLIVDNIENCKLPSDAYDKILSVNNYTIWKHPKKGLQNLYHALKTGGKIAITMQPREKNAGPDRTREMAKQIYNDLIQCGFKHIETHFKHIRPELAVCVTAYKMKK